MVPSSRPAPVSPSTPRLARLVALALLALAAQGTALRPVAAQTLDDGFLVPARQLRVGVTYAHEAWDHYWEGTLRRDNANLGTLTTQSVTPTLSYGLTSRVSLLAALPHVRTNASAGVLRGQRGWQDATLAAKVGLPELPVAGRATLATVVQAGASAPASRYTPDLLPLSIGLATRRATLRGAFHLQDRSGFFAEGSAARNWRSTVRLDRPAYFTEGQLVLSDEVAMPDVMEYAAAIGYQRFGLCLPIMLVAQRTLGGGDIRRQDMPFVSNRMDFTRLHAKAMYFLPPIPGLQLEVGAARTLAGRNIGDATMFSVGFTTAFRP